MLCEKPVGEGGREAEPLYRLAADRGLLLLAAPFVQLNPTFRALWTAIADGAIGRPHSARALYGTAGATWALWFHDGSVGPLAELGIYNLKSLTALLGPVEEIQIAESTAVPSREVAGERLDEPGHDVQHVILRHAGGALSSLVTGQAIQRYRRPALEVYGTEGTANLLGDDWDSSGYELWRNSAAFWESHDSLDPTWLWCDGLRELVACLREERAPLADSVARPAPARRRRGGARRLARAARRGGGVGIRRARPSRGGARTSSTTSTTARGRRTSSERRFSLKQPGGVCSLPLHVVGIFFT